MTIVPQIVTLVNASVLKFMDSISIIYSTLVFFAKIHTYLLKFTDLTTYPNLLHSVLKSKKVSLIEAEYQ